MRAIVNLVIAALLSGAMTSAAEAQSVGNRPSYGWGNLGGGFGYGNLGPSYGYGNLPQMGAGNGYGTVVPGTVPSNIIPGYPIGGYNPYYYGGYGVPVATPYAPVAPLVPGYVKLGPLNIQYWRAPSGYYYPWGMGASTYSTGQIYIVNQGTPTAQNPPLYSMFSDMISYLDTSKKDGRIDGNDYKHIYRRLQDLRSKYDHFISLTGSIDPQDEENLRRDLALVGREMAMRVKPLADSKGSSAAQPTASPGPSIRRGSPEPLDF